MLRVVRNTAQIPSLFEVWMSNRVNSNELKLCPVLWHAER